MPPNRNASFLLVANWDSNVGYAWWLMESFWVVLARRYASDFRMLLAYPSISTIPSAINSAPLLIEEQTIGLPGISNLIDDCRFLIKHSVKIIYFSDHPSIRLRYLAYRACGVRVIIVHDHTPGVRTPPRGIKRLAKWLIQRIPFITADGLIGASDYVRERFIDVNCIPPAKCFSAPNGLPSRAQQPLQHSLRKELNINSNAPIAVMTGRANHYKNIGFVLECLALLKQQNRAVHFLFCGDGPDLEQLKTMAMQLKIEDRVTFAGRRNDVPQLLSQCDFAIHPSLGEVGYSLSILEYMQAGLPVLVPNNPSVCAATTHDITGLIYENGCEKALNAAILRLVDNPDDRLRMGKNAAQVVDQQFNLESTHSALILAFEETLSRKNFLRDAAA